MTQTMGVRANAPSLSMPAAQMRRMRWAAFCLLSYMLFSMIGSDPFAATIITAKTADGSVANQIIGVGLVLALLVTAWRQDNVWLNQALPVSLLVLLAYCAMTISWSAVPGIAIRRLLLTAMTMWLMFRATWELGYGRGLLVLRATMVILLVLNYACVMFLDSGVHQYEIGLTSSEVGDWRGIMIHKNIAGAACALTVLLFLFDDRGMDKLIRNAVVFAALVFLYFTHSKASMGALAVAILLGGGLRFFRFDSKSHLYIYAVMLVLVLVPASALYYGKLIQQLDDPQGFTGRSAIWSLLLLYARSHFWTGAGFGSFWQVGDGSPIWHLTAGWVAQLAAGGHNGYLDLLVTIGFPGLVLAVTILLILPVRRLLLEPQIASGQRGLLFAIIVFCVCDNLAETQLLDRNAVDQMFLVLAIAFTRMLARPIPHRSFRQLGQAALLRLGLKP